MPPLTLATAPDQPYSHVSRQMNKILEQLQKGYSNFYPSETWTPAVNLYETEGAYHVSVDLAGVDKEKIDLTIHGQRLVLKGSRVVPSCPEIAAHANEEPDAEGHHRKARVHVMEIDHGGFSREVELPHTVDKDRIVAKYVDGMLWVHLPKK